MFWERGEKGRILRFGEVFNSAMKRQEANNLKVLLKWGERGDDL